MSSVTLKSRALQARMSRCHVSYRHQWPLVTQQTTDVSSVLFYGCSRNPSLCLLEKIAQLHIDTTQLTCSSSRQTENQNTHIPQVRCVVHLTLVIKPFQCLASYCTLIYLQVYEPSRSPGSVFELHGYDGFLQRQENVMFFGEQPETSEIFPTCFVSKASLTRSYFNHAIYLVNSSNPNEVYHWYIRHQIWMSLLAVIGRVCKEI